MASGSVAVPGSSRLAMPKSSSFGSPAAVTRMLAGFRSRWTSRFWWAYWTAAQIRRKRSRRLVDGELVVVAVLVDGQPLDELHHQVGAAVLGAAAVVEAGDVGVLEAGEDLPLGEEAVERLRALGSPERMTLTATSRS